LNLHTLGLLALDILRLVAGPWATLPEGYGDTLDPEELAGEVAGQALCSRCGCCPLVLEECRGCDGLGYFGLATVSVVYCSDCDGNATRLACARRCDAEGRHP
jgi:hypothetical protein